MLIPIAVLNAAKLLLGMCMLVFLCIILLDIYFKCFFELDCLDKSPHCELIHVCPLFLYMFRIMYMDVHVV